MVDAQKGYSGLWIQCFDLRDSGVAFLKGAGTQVDVCSMLCKASDCIEATTIFKYVRKYRWTGRTYMPEFPPVTMYTLPARFGRESGWKVMVTRQKGNRFSNNRRRKV